MADETPELVDVGTDLDEGQEFDILETGDGGRASVGELARSILKSDSNQLGQDNDVDLLAPRKPTQNYDPLADAEPDDEADDEPQEPQISAPAAQTEPPKETSPTASPDQLWSLLESQSGFSLRDKYATPDEAIKGLANAQRALSQRDEFAALGRQIQEHPEAALQWLAESLGKVPSAAAAAPEPKKDEPAPQYDPTWNHWIDSATGEWKANTPQSVIDSATKYQEHRQREQVRALVKPDLDALKNEITERDKRIAALQEKIAARDQIEQHSAESQQRAASIKQAVMPHTSWIFEGGNPNGAVTEAGKVFERHLVAMQHEITNPQLLAKAAYDATVIELSIKTPAGGGTHVDKGRQQAQAERLAAKPAQQSRPGGRDPWKGKTPTAKDLAAELSRYVDK